MSSIVIISSTLAGGRVNCSLEKIPVNHTCTPGTRFPQCSTLDITISKMHVKAPWIILLSSLAILSMPTILLKSKYKEKAMQNIAWIFLQCLLLMTISILIDHPSIAYTLSSHSCIYMLFTMNIHPNFTGGSSWWALRYVSILVFVVFQISIGPPISVVKWPDTEDNTSCAYLAHLIGIIFPPIISCLLTTMSHLACFVTTLDDT